jgi:DNA-binding transcriptional ArsR family regulator
MATHELDTIFSALADPTRRRILEKLKSRDYTVVELSGLFDMSLPAVSKHLKILDQAKLLKKEKDGKYIVCRYNPKTFGKALKWIDKQYQFWNDGFDSLEKLMDRDK